MAESTAHILQSLLVNLLIAAAKGVAAGFTGSGAMVAETIHSSADCGNQLLLLLGVNRARVPPDRTHPLGHGRALYFWSFIVALMLFTGGGLFSIYEGVHKMGIPHAPEQLWLGQLILGVSLVLEGWAAIGNIRELNRRRGPVPFFRHLRQSKDSDLIVVFGENAAAVLGLALAMGALTIAGVTGDSRWDGAGSVAIGAVLVAVALFLAIEVKSLLLGERADPDLEACVRDLAAGEPGIQELLSLITLQQGPGEVLVACKLRFGPTIDGNDLVAAINRFETALRARRPEVKWCFVEPDVEA
jgi:cation diffusion facilitator family transporter